MRSGRITLKVMPALTGTARAIAYMTELASYG